MKFKLFLLTLVVCPLWAQNFADEVNKSSGESIKIEINCDQDQGYLYIYRKTGITTTAYRVASIPLEPNKFSYEWQTTMPANTVRQYRFFAVPVKVSGTNLLYGPASNEGLITRK